MPEQKRVKFISKTGLQKNSHLAFMPGSGVFDEYIIHLIDVLSAFSLLRIGKSDLV
jgi:hypothetical protein